MTRRNSGFSLTEILVTVAIVIGVITLGIVSLRGYLPKRNLLASMQDLENALQKAQTESVRQGRWTCIRLFSAEGIRSFVDTNNTHAGSGVQREGCGDSGDEVLGSPIPFRGRTRLARAAATPIPGARDQREAEEAREDAEERPDERDREPVPTPKPVPRSLCTPEGAVFWFDDQGKPHRCVSGSCLPVDFQIVLANDDLASGARAREVEVTEAGLIQTVKPGEKGLNLTSWANSQITSNGCE